MSRPELYARCPVCNRRVALGLYGRLIPYHKNKGNRVCKGEGEWVGESSKEPGNFC